jgi:hypothetical protein
MMPSYRTTGSFTFVASPKDEEALSALYSRASPCSRYLRFSQLASRLSVRWSGFSCQMMIIWRCWSNTMGSLSASVLVEGLRALDRRWITYDGRLVETRAGLVAALAAYRAFGIRSVI